MATRPKKNISSNVFRDLFTAGYNKQLDVPSLEKKT